MARPLSTALVGSLMLVLGLAPGLVACASYRGARLYAAGNTSLDHGEVDQAVAQLEQAAALVPHASEIQNDLGVAYLAAGRSADARRAFERAVDLDCDNKSATANLRALRRGGASPTP